MKIFLKNHQAKTLSTVFKKGNMKTFVKTCARCGLHTNKDQIEYVVDHIEEYTNEEFGWHLTYTDITKLYDSESDSDSTVSTNDKTINNNKNLNQNTNYNYKNHGMQEDDK